MTDLEPFVDQLCSLLRTGDHAYIQQALELIRSLQEPALYERLLENVSATTKDGDCLQLNVDAIEKRFCLDRNVTLELVCRLLGDVYQDWITQGKLPPHRTASFDLKRAVFDPSCLSQ